MTETGTNDGMRSYDLAERTTAFAKCIIAFAKTVPSTPVNHPLVRQLVRAATSVGANYREACDAVSKKDFRNKIGICRKEAGETEYWLEMIGASEKALTDQARALWSEVHELHLIFGKSFTTAGGTGKTA